MGLPGGLEVPGSQGCLGRDLLLAPSQGSWHEEPGRQDGLVTKDRNSSREEGLLSPPGASQAVCSQAPEASRGAGSPL